MPSDGSARALRRPRAVLSIFTDDERRARARLRKAIAMSGSGWQQPHQYGRQPQPPRRRGFPTWALWVLIVGGGVVVAAGVVVVNVISQVAV